MIENHKDGFCVSFFCLKLPAYIEIKNNTAWDWSYKKNMDKERFAVALMTCNGAYDNCNTAQVKIYVPKTALCKYYLNMQVN